MGEGARRKRRPPCRDASHRKHPDRGQCLTCRDARYREKRIAERAARGEVLLLPPGKTERHAGCVAGWETKRAKYGPSGKSEEGARRQRAQAARQPKANARKTHCKYGHPLSGDNVAYYVRVLSDGRRWRQRVCRTCGKAHRRALHRGETYRPTRPEWARSSSTGARLHIPSHDAWCVAEGRKLWAEVLRRHPDRGGSADVFQRAKRRLDAFLARERDWYQDVGLTLPHGMKGDWTHTPQGAEAQ